MAQKTQVRRRQTAIARPLTAPVQPSPAETPSAKDEQHDDDMLPENLTITHWFDPASFPGRDALTVRFSGQRIAPAGTHQPEAQFVQDEQISGIVAGCGPIAVTARVKGITPGEWKVTAQVVESHRAARKRQAQHTGSDEEPSPLAAAGSPAALWHNWGASTNDTRPIRSRLFPFARVPGVIPGAWLALVTTGVIVALLIQSAVIRADHLAIGGSLWLVSGSAIAAGVVGAKLWYIVKHWRKQRREGWCIQGFVLGAALTAIIALLALHTSPGAYFDAMAPGLLLGLAVGRIGCFFGGCCEGRCTSARWGIWSSDQRVGARRIPTQLIESAFALCAGIVTLLAILHVERANGAYFIAAVAAYTLGRQGILKLRAERHNTRMDRVVTAVSALALLASVVAIIV